ncbi:MAG TPA: iron-containing redox enzyme family protein [Acidimicrobiales bacterium]|nr:iron-containing redox enzyme family protein [Acidimicrobiales bacterium]
MAVADEFLTAGRVYLETVGPVLRIRERSNLPFDSASLPSPRGPISEVVLDAFMRPPGWLELPSFSDTNPLTNDDEALALYLCYELNYQGLPSCDPEWEWEPSLLELRKVLEHRYLKALREHIPPMPQNLRARHVVSLLATAPGRSLAQYLEQQGTIEEFREFAIHRSAYQLKEADPHTWAIPRLTGRSKAALVFIQYEEYGEGVPEEMHSALFAKTMDAFGLNSGYGYYIDHIPGITLSTVNLVSLFGLHRRWRGALIGHLALFEMVSTRPNASYARGLRRLGLGEDAARFFDAHVVADATHEVIALEQLLGGLVDSEAAIEPDVAFGAEALAYLDGLLTDHLLEAWTASRSSLLP